MTKRMLVLPALALLVLAASAPADIKGTAHDFSTWGWADNEVCKPCHTPHNAVQGDTNPGVNHILWNHEITQATFTLFDGTEVLVAQTPDADQTESPLPVGRQNLLYFLQEVSDIIPYAADSKLTEIGQILPDLRGIHTAQGRQFLR